MTHSKHERELTFRERKEEQEYGRLKERAKITERVRQVERQQRARRRAQ